jgi:signal transduction histidine kinase
LISAKIKGPIAEIMVTDRGPGVPAAERERVLGRFVRLEASRSEPGSGLGLSLVAAVARLHGGSLRLEDNAPGLRVILALPLEGEALVNGAPHQAPAGAEIRPA